MKLKKLLKKLNFFLHADKQLQHDKDEALANVLKKLKKKEMKLQEELDLETDEIDASSLSRN